MEASTTRRLEGLKDKIPDIQSTLSTVSFLRTRSPSSSPLQTTFELADTLFAKATVPHTPEVYLWLGANVMLAYPLDEAQALLTEKLEGAREKMKDCEEDIDFLREQITTLEVATARVYNWDVGMRRKERVEAEAEGSGRKGREEGED